MDSTNVSPINSSLTVLEEVKLTIPAVLAYTVDGIYSDDELYWFKYIPIKYQRNIATQIMEDDGDLFYLCECGLVKLDDMMLFDSEENAKNSVDHLGAMYKAESKYGRFSRVGNDFITYQPLHISDGKTIFDLDICFVKNIFGKDMSLTVDDVSTGVKKPLLRMVNRRVELRNDVDMEDVTELLDKLVHKYPLEVCSVYIW